MSLCPVQSVKQLLRWQQITKAESKCRLQLHYVRCWASISY